MEAFLQRGLKHVVLCPGSRSAPLALAAGLLSRLNKLNLITSIDERSAAFLALGISTATGKASVVITTSGSAVAHLLPAAIEADRSCQPIIFVTADRPSRLKNCGANQTVNQEEFLLSVCRDFEQGPGSGLHQLSSESIYDLVGKSWQKAHHRPGPVHINLPFEEPLHPSLVEQEHVFSVWKKEFFKNKRKNTKIFLENSINKTTSELLPSLDPSSPGVVIVGPWRGLSENLKSFQEVLRKWQIISGWPIFADPLSGVSNHQTGLISNWEFLLKAGLPFLKESLQVLRLGPMPSSHILEDWLNLVGNKQVLITEGDSRRLDPLQVSSQWSWGLVNWWRSMESNGFIFEENSDNNLSMMLLKSCIERDISSEKWLYKYLPLQGPISELALAFWLPRLLPAGLPVMLSASSPIRDWLTYSGKESLKRRCYGFRGASGIDGTLSLGMGLSLALGPTFLITGDLALLHDSNGWLFSYNESPPLVVLVIDNGGGGIFKQLNLETESNETFNKLFSMPQAVDTLSLVSAYGVPYRQVSCLEDLKASIDWSLSNSGPVLLRVCTDSVSDALMRSDFQDRLSQHLHSSHQDCFCNE